nr:MAG TPA: hypothetical protein [Caudoviricetes sp.]
MVNAQADAHPVNVGEWVRHKPELEDKLRE